jgi:hypothetical protein
MATEIQETLPKMLAGVVLEQWVRCGKPNCQCALDRPHGPYFYRFWREAGRLRKGYVKLAELGNVRAGCEARQALQRQVKIALQQWRQMKSLIKEVEQR